MRVPRSLQELDRSLQLTAKTKGKKKKQVSLPRQSQTKAQNKTIMCDFIYQQSTVSHNVAMATSFHSTGSGTSAERKKTASKRIR